MILLFSSDDYAYSDCARDQDFYRFSCRLTKLEKNSSSTAGFRMSHFPLEIGFRCSSEKHFGNIHFEVTVGLFKERGRRKTLLIKNPKWETWKFSLFLFFLKIVSRLFYTRKMDRLSSLKEYSLFCFEKISSKGRLESTFPSTKFVKLMNYDNKNSQTALD